MLGTWWPLGKSHQSRVGKVTLLPGFQPNAQLVRTELTRVLNRVCSPGRKSLGWVRNWNGLRGEGGSTLKRVELVSTHVLS